MTSQLYWLSRNLEANLQRRKYPIQIVYVPSVVEYVSWFPGLIVLGHDVEGADSYAGPVGMSLNPKSPETRQIACAARIYAQSPVDGADVQDHEAELERILDGFVTGLWDYCRRSKWPHPQIVSGRYIEAAKHCGAAVGFGVLYQLKFLISRPLALLDYDGAILPTAVVARAVTTQVTVVVGDSEEDISL